MGTEVFRNEQKPQARQGPRTVIFTSAKEVMFLPVFVCLCVCVCVCVCVSKITQKVMDRFF